MIALANMTDPKVLLSAALILERENQKLISQNLNLSRELLRLQGATPAELQLRMEELERQIANANKARFGRSSEIKKKKKLVETDEDATKATPGHGPTEQPGLKLVEEILQLRNLSTILRQRKTEITDSCSLTRLLPSAC